MSTLTVRVFTNLERTEWQDTVYTNVNDDREQLFREAYAQLWTDPPPLPEDPPAVQHTETPFGFAIIENGMCIHSDVSTFAQEPMA